MRSNVQAKKIVMVASQKKYAALRLRTRMEYFVPMNLHLMAAQLNAMKQREKCRAPLMKLHLDVSQKQLALLVQKGLMGNSVLAIRYVKSSVNGMKPNAQMAMILEGAKMQIYVWKEERTRTAIFALQCVLRNVPIPIFSVQEHFLEMAATVRLNVHQGNMIQTESNVHKYALFHAGSTKRYFQEKKMLEAALPKTSVSLHVLEVMLAVVGPTNAMLVRETVITIVIAWMD
jgi:hypothetical protein